MLKLLINLEKYPLLKEYSMKGNDWTVLNYDEN